MCASHVLQAMSDDEGSPLDEQLTYASTSPVRARNPPHGLCGRHCLHFTKENT